MPDLTAEDIEKIKETFSKKIGENIRNAREKKNLTQRELASMIISDRQYLYKIESGRVGVSVAKLAIIAAALGVDVRELI